MNTHRFIAGSITAFVVSYGATALTLALLSTFLWAWLAALAALCVGVTAGVLAGTWAQTDGYDLAVELAAQAVVAKRKAVAWLSARFA